MVFAGMLLVAFASAAHFAIVEAPEEAALGASLSLIPLAALAVWCVRRTRHRYVAVLAVASAVVVLWSVWSSLERYFPRLFFIEHTGANLVLAIVFGRTLAGNREALCTRFARLIHGTLPPEVERYTRQVTAAWTLFFVVVFTLSSVLYLYGFLAAWSLLANILSPVLVAGMFAAEYVVRHRVLPKWERAGVLSSLRAFKRYFAAAQPEAPR
ncbi:MAG TPA: hypothetical protein VJX31_11650 [Casimicrobiaceae bacterium]|nr:hypothetical protein [Casimicrobiaceae bacterium]